MFRVLALSSCRVDMPTFCAVYFAETKHEQIEPGHENGRTDVEPKPELILFILQNIPPKRRIRSRSGLVICNGYSTRTANVPVGPQ